MARKVRGFERVLDAPRAVRRRVRRDRLVDLLRARDRRGLRARADAARARGHGRSCSCSSRSRTPRARPRSPRRAAPRRSRGAPSTTSSASSPAGSLFLDYLIVIALSALFLPHYVGAALEADALRDRPWDVVVAVSAIALIGGVPSRATVTAAPAGARRRPARPARAVARSWSSGSRSSSRRRRSSTASSLAPGQDWLDDLALRDPARDARLHRPRDGRQPRRGGARARPDPAALAVLRDRARRRRSPCSSPSSASRRSRPRTTARPSSATSGSRRPLVGIVTAFDGELPAGLVDVLRSSVGLSRRAHPDRWRSRRRSPAARAWRTRWATHGMLPREFGRFERRTLVSRRGDRRDRRRRDRRRDRRGRDRTTRRSSSRASTRSASCSRSPPRSSR